jgi:ferrous iron transport protein B
MPYTLVPRTTEKNRRSLTVAIVGNPNTGKSTLFNALSGGAALTGNYPGCTVEKKLGRMRCKDCEVTLIDLPGTYSLSPRSLDEMVTVDVLLGRQPDVGHPDAVVCIVDASNIERNLYLVSQVLDIGLPTILVLNMTDVAEFRGLRINATALSRKLSLPVLETQAHRKRGIDELRKAIVAVTTDELPRPLEGVGSGEGRPSLGIDCEPRSETPAPHPLTPSPPAGARGNLFPAAFDSETELLRSRLSAWGETDFPPFLVRRLLLDTGGYLETAFGQQSHGVHLDAARHEELLAHLRDARQRLADAGCKVPAVEARVRYAWVREMLDGVVTKPATRPVTFSDKLDRVLTHRVSGLVIFAALMFVVFQALYSWAAYLQSYCEAGQGWVSGQVAAAISPGPLRSLLIDGVIAGVGGVLVFLPQIVILFLFIALLEDCGYMARAAFLMDKLMTKVGLSGKSFVPLMSSFACAIPGVMATRVIENRRDRMTTILVAPLMSCSARQPVYALMIGCFIPATTFAGDWINLQGLTLFGMTSLGALVAVPIAWLFRKTLFRGEPPPFVMELPTYKWPSPRIVLQRVYWQARAFVTRAGTLILAVTVLVWAASFFPANHADVYDLQRRLSEIELRSDLTDEARSELAAPLLDEQARVSAALLERSWLGQAGHLIEPAVRPLGWDWKIGVGVLASFPAREVIVGTLGTIYSLGGTDDPEDSALRSALQDATWPDGRKVYNVPVALSVMVFFALCAQCASTLMVIRRETGNWGWPAFTFAYMTALAYAGAWIAYRVAMAFA